jgi:hypothetical protein
LKGTEVSVKHKILNNKNYSPTSAVAAVTVPIAIVSLRSPINSIAKPVPPGITTAPQALKVEAKFNPVATVAPPSGAAAPITT